MSQNSRPVVLIADKLAQSTVDALGDSVEVRWVDGPNRPELLEAVKDADALLVRSATTVDAEVLEAAPKLQIVGRAGVGLDNVDIETATARGVMVANAPTSNIHSACELAISLLLATARQIPAADKTLRDHEWKRSAFKGVEIFGKTVGIVGFGHIGQLFAQRLAAFETDITAYGFTRWRGKVRSFLFFFYVILMLMPYQVTLVPNYLVSQWLGILNTRWAIIFPGMFAPFSVFLLTKFMRRIPASLIEAAKLDGSSEWQIFKDICLPQCRSALYSIAILVFIDYWNMVEQPIVLLPDASKQPLSVYLSTINANEVGLAFAIATIYMVPCILLFLHGEDYLVEGIAHQGSVKG